MHGAFFDPAATLDDLQNSITTTLEEMRITRRVLGGAHPVTTGIEEDAQETRRRARMNRRSQRQGVHKAHSAKTHPSLASKLRRSPSNSGGRRPWTRAWY